MAKPRRAQRERNSNVSSTEYVQPAGSDTGAEGSEQPQSGMPAEDRNSVVAIEPESAQHPEFDSNTRASSSSRNSSRGSSRTPRVRTPRIDPQKSKEGLTVLIAGIHSFAAKMVHECMELDEQEAKDLAGAIVGVNELYDNGLISPKAAAWGNLIMTFGSVYAPRAIVMLRTRKEKKGGETG